MIVVVCEACGAVIEGSCIVEHRLAYHPWCWHTRKRAQAHPGLDAIAQDLTTREKHEPKPLA